MTKKIKGFTLIELMVTMAVLGVLAAIAIPSMGNILRNNRITSATNEIFSVLSTARHEAIKRKIDITVAPSGSDWTDGITVSDANGVIFSSQAFPDSLRSSTASERNTIVFTPSGYTTSSQPWGGDGGGLQICGSEGEGRVITLKRSGSISTNDISC